MSQESMEEDFSENGFHALAKNSSGLDTLYSFRQSVEDLFGRTHREHLAYFEFAGKVFALAVVNSVQFQAHLSVLFLKLIIGNQLLLRTLNRRASFRAHVRGNELLLRSGEENKSPSERMKFLVGYRMKCEMEMQGNTFCQGLYYLISMEKVKVFDGHELDLGSAVKIGSASRTSKSIANSSESSPHRTQ
jgi:hypothetical protein